MIDKHWGELEWDFQTILNLRAMDWIEGKKDWREFYRLKSRLGMGTEYFSAVVNDPEIAQVMADQLEADPERRKGPTNPPAAGWFPWKDDMADIKDHLIALRAVTAGAKSHEVQFTKRPVFEVERIRRQKAVKRLRKATSMLLPHQNINVFDFEKKDK